MYSPKVRELLASLEGRGGLAYCTHRGRADNPVCGDVVEFDLVCRAGRIADCGFRAEGCPAAVAAAAAVRQLVLGRSPDEAGRLGQAQVLEFLESLPSHKLHGIDVALDALRTALRSPVGLA
jgi:NifU-like protein involved in Fe-S cluster formation